MVWEVILEVVTTTNLSHFSAEAASAAESWIVMYSVCQTLDKVDDAILQKVFGVSASIKILAKSIDCAWQLP